MSNFKERMKDETPGSNPFIALALLMPFAIAIYVKYFQ